MVQALTFKHATLLHEKGVEWDLRLMQDFEKYQVVKCRANNIEEQMDVTARTKKSLQQQAMNEITAEWESQIRLKQNDIQQVF